MRSRIELVRMDDTGHVAMNIQQEDNEGELTGSPFRVLTISSDGTIKLHGGLPSHLLSVTAEQGFVAISNWDAVSTDQHNAWHHAHSSADDTEPSHFSPTFDEPEEEDESYDEEEDEEESDDF